MKFEEIIPALRAGKKVKQKHWKDVYLHINSSGLCELSGRNADHTLLYCKISSLLENDDWEIIEEPKKATIKVKLRDLTKEQYREYENSCAERICTKCPFHDVECNLQNNNCWFHHKDLYNDKFLDQEIEIEVEDNNGKN